MLLPGVGETACKRGVVEQAAQRGGNRVRVAPGQQQPGSLMQNQFARTAGVIGYDRKPGSHRLQYGIGAALMLAQHEGDVVAAEPLRCIEHGPVQEHTLIQINADGIDDPVRVIRVALFARAQYM